MKKEAQKLTNLELSEMTIMVSEMLGQIERFSHVSDKMNLALKSKMEKYYEVLCGEQDDRERMAEIFDIELVK